MIEPKFLRVDAHRAINIDHIMSMEIEAVQLSLPDEGGPVPPNHILLVTLATGEQFRIERCSLSELEDRVRLADERGRLLA
jgi:hypothetical protein